jgi:phage shock protein PspC (stress-responsive transcriptional regulator)
MRAPGRISVTSSYPRVIAGVCGLLATKYNWNVTFIRFAFVLSSPFYLVGPLLYVVLAILNNQKSSGSGSAYEANQRSESRAEQGHELPVLAARIERREAVLKTCRSLSWVLAGSMVLILVLVIMHVGDASILGIFMLLGFGFLGLRMYVAIVRGDTKRLRKRLVIAADAEKDRPKVCPECSASVPRAAPICAACGCLV